MASIPFMPLYVSDYLADTPHLSALEHGAYLLLIMTYWQRQKPLPADDKKLARIARVTPDEWAGMKDELLDLFTLDGNVYRHTRIDAELTKAQQKIEQAKRAGSASAATRAQRNSNARSTPVQQTHQRNANHKDTDTEGNSNELPMRRRGPYSEEFENDFWKPYPSQGQSKADAFAEWQKLSQDDRRAAVAALPAFRQHEDARLKRSPDSGRLHACRYLKQRRWEGFEVAPQAEAGGVEIGLYHPNRSMWQAYWHARRAENVPDAVVKFMMYTNDRVVREETEVPPGYTPLSEAAE